MLAYVSLAALLWSLVCGRDAMVCSCAEILGFLGCDQITRLQPWH